MPHRKALFRAGLGLSFLFALATPAFAAEALHGDHIPLFESFPFAGLLLSIALGPIFAKRLWHVHYGKAAAFWALLSLGLLVWSQGLAPTTLALAESIILEYLPFILMLFALYTAAGGLVVSELDRATPLTNTVLLAAGTLAASLIGTTGSSMILIRPILQANAKRRQHVHVVIFFIFLVSNIGGILSPLGDPPLFFGFLRGIDFFWPLQALWPHMLVTSGILLILFYLLDHYFFWQDKRAERKAEAEAAAKAGTTAPEVAEAEEEGELRLTIRGLPNFLLIGVVVAVISLSAVWRPGIIFDIFGLHLELQNLLRDVGLLGIGLLSLAITPESNRRDNHFSWEPLLEVAKLFAAIFVCIIPVMAMLAANSKGPFAPLIALLANKDGTPNDIAYFWTTGLLSSFLDNAPTYLVFFGMAGGDPATLMGPLVKTLEAISLGAVFMGALTYIGNAPNFMVYAMARRARVEMPGFFGFMAWSGVILVPVFILLTVLFLR